MGFLIVLGVMYLVWQILRGLERVSAERERQRRQDEWFAKPLAERLRLRGHSEEDIAAFTDDSVDGMTWAAMSTAVDSKRSATAAAAAADRSAELQPRQ